MSFEYTKEIEILSFNAVNSLNIINPCTILIKFSIFLYIAPPIVRF